MKSDGFVDGVEGVVAVSGVVVVGVVGAVGVTHQETILFIGDSLGARGAIFAHSLRQNDSA